MMKCYVLTLRTDWVMILFSNTDEVIVSAMMDFVTVSFCSSREDRKANTGLGKAALRGCCVFSQGQGRLLGVCSASLQLLTAVSWVVSDVLEESSLKRYVICWGPARRKDMGEPVLLLVSTTVHLQAGWELLQPLPAEAGPSPCNNSCCFWVSSSDSPGSVPGQVSAATDAFLIRPQLASLISALLCSNLIQLHNYCHTQTTV